MARRTITDSAWVIFALCLRSALCADSGKDFCSAVCALIKADLYSSDSCAKARRSLPRPTIGLVCQDAFDKAFRLTCLETCTFLHGTGQAPPSRIAEACSKRKRETPKPVVYQACLEGFKGGLNATVSLVTERLDAANAQESLWDLNQDGKERGCGANHSKSVLTAVCGVDQSSSSASPIDDVKKETHGEGSDSTIDEPLEHYSDRVEREQAGASSDDNLRQASNKSEASQGKSETGEEHENIEARHPIVDNSKHAFVDNIASRDVTTPQAKYTTATGYQEVEHTLRGGIDKETSVMYGNDNTLLPSGFPTLETNSTEK